MLDASFLRGVDQGCGRRRARPWVHSVRMATAQTTANDGSTCLTSASAVATGNVAKSTTELQRPRRSGVGRPRSGGPCRRRSWAPWVDLDRRRRGKEPTAAQVARVGAVGGAGRSRRRGSASESLRRRKREMPLGAALRLCTRESRGEEGCRWERKYGATTIFSNLLFLGVNEIRGAKQVPHIWHL
jgi:hypothetical protein